MTKFMLAGAAALALSAGATFAATTTSPVPDNGYGTQQTMPSAQRYAFMPQAGEASGYAMPGTATPAVWTPSGYAGGHSEYLGATPPTSGGNG